MAEPRRTFTREYKLSAVKLVTEQGRSFSEAARSLGIAAELLHRWKATFKADGADAFPGHGNLPPAEDELRRLKAEVARLKAERDILKKLRRSSPGSRCELRVHQAACERLPGHVALRDTRCVRRRLLLLAGASTESPATTA